MAHRQQLVLDTSAATNIRYHFRSYPETLGLYRKCPGRKTSSERAYLPGVLSIEAWETGRHPISRGRIPLTVLRNRLLQGEYMGSVSNPSIVRVTAWAIS
jgi:hypothetical protein